MSTKERLAEVLERAGLVTLAERARAGRFDDYESNSVTPIRDLVAALQNAGREDLARRAMNGEWDASKEEAESWYQREGRRLF